MMREGGYHGQQHRIAEALNEHLAVIYQLAAVSSQMVEVASALVATLRRQGKGVLMGNGGSACYSLTVSPGVVFQTWI